MIAVPLNAPPAISPLDLLAAAGIPAAAPQTGAGPRFHSILQAFSDKVESPKARSAKTDSAPDDALAVAIPVFPQRTITLPLTLNLTPQSDRPGKNDADSSEADSAIGESPATYKVSSARAPRDVATRTALGNESRIKQNEQTAPETQPDPDLPLTVAANTADGSLSKLEPAFEAHLQPAELPESAAPAPAAVASGKPDAPPPTKDNATEVAEPPIVAAPDAATGVAQAAASSSKQGDGSHHPDRERSQDTASAAPNPAANAEAPLPRFDVTAPTAPVVSATSSTHAASRMETIAPVEPSPTPEPRPLPVAPATHDIKLELNSGGQRVELRLTERAGDVHVAVRTPDARLSQSMRDDLPALTAKLERSGFQADAWHPGAPANGERRTAETGSGSLSQDSQEHSEQHPQQQQRDDSQQQNPKNPTNAANRKTDRKDFAWLLQTYR